jgi:predicted glycogen debranching enzyme
MEHLDGDKHVLLSTLDCTIIQGKSEFNLGIHKYQGDNYTPKGHKYVQDFQAEQALQIYYRVGDVRLVRESLLVEKEQQVLIRYTILEAEKPITLKFTPFLAFRNVHQLSKANLHAQTRVKKIKNGVKSRLYDGYPYLNMQFSKEAEFVASPDWYYDIEYLEEQHRGYDYKEDLFVPGYFELSVKKGEAIIFSAGTTESNPLNLNRKYALELNKRVPRIDFRNCLLNSAQQFIVRKEKKTEITAGFHWYGTSSRDTFTALPGLTLPQNDLKTFKAVTDSMVQNMSQGLFPNIGPDGDMYYTSVDASLWFIWALQQYCLHTGNCTYIWKTYQAPVKSILDHFRKGTVDNIKMLDNGLIYAGEPGKALTWMNAYVNGKPVTPRTGCTVEVNALWYNAIIFCIDIAGKASDHAFVKKWQSLPEKIRGSFIAAFWDENQKYLADFVDGKYKDWAIRPNQVIAASMHFSPLTPEMKKAVLEVVKRDLLTRRGLRSLTPMHPDYIGKYEGNQVQRDMAFHQGSVWPWLLQHFCQGYLGLFKKSGISVIKNLIKDFESTVTEHGLGTVSEIYDGDPPHKPRGAISQASGVAALLMVIDLVDEVEMAE